MFLVEERRNGQRRAEIFMRPDGLLRDESIVSHLRWQVRQLERKQNLKFVELRKPSHA